MYGQGIRLHRNGAQLIYFLSSGKGHSLVLQREWRRQILPHANPQTTHLQAGTGIRSVICQWVFPTSADDRLLEPYCSTMLLAHLILKTHSFAKRELWTSTGSAT